jgi:hypothetical protein
MCIVAPSGSGKTTFLINLIKLFCQGKGTFQTINIITRNKDEPLYNWLKSQSNDIIISEGLNKTPLLDKFDKDFQHLVVWDDLVLSKDLSPVENYYLRARKMNVSVIFLSQSYFDIPSFIRKNCNYMVILKLSGKRDVNTVLNEFSLGLERQQLLNMFDYATRDKFDALLIDCDEEPEKRFRKNFLEWLNPDNFM